MERGKKMADVCAVGVGGRGRWGGGGWSGWGEGGSTGGYVGSVN